ncbi:MAG: hypothetical protein ACPGN3_04405 [Opitutales bacterium]
MPEVPNITENLARLREKRGNVVFNEETASAPKPPKRTQVERVKSYRASPLSWLAIGLAGALFIFEVVAANLFTILNR